MLYPLKFRPILKEKIWGGHKIETLLDKELSDGICCGESWEISGIEDDVSVVENGQLAENDLNELIEVYMGDLVGEKVYDEFGLGFPLLIKFIDANDCLSVQVHPDDNLAQKRYHQNGKTELWYIIDAEEGSGLYIGFKKGVTKEQFVQAVTNGTVDALLEFYPVKKNDVFFIPAGTVHAIGKGVLLTEIQQSSDITYRIFDWNRTDAEGKSRELHVEDALEAIHFNETTDYKISVEEKFDSSTSIMRSSYFNINMIHFEKPLQKVYVEIDSFIIYICIEGHVHCFTEDEQITLERGEVMLIPATTSEINFVPCETCRLLEVYL